MRRSILEFSIRTVGEPSDVPDVRRRVEAALGCRFSEGAFHNIPALVTDLLGMRVGLFGWRGREDRSVIRMDSHVGDERLLAYDGDEAPDLEYIDIGPAVVDLLKVTGAGHWYLPDAADIAAELAYGEELDRVFLADPGDHESA